MKNAVLRFLPYVLGALMGWLIASPPAAFASLGPWRYVVFAALAVTGVGAVAAVAMLAAAPENVQLTPVDPEATRALAPLEQQLLALGFTRIGAYTVEVRPPAKVVALVHEAERTYGAAFLTSTVPSKTFFDLVSILEGDRGGLSSSATREAGATPSIPGSLRQYFPGAPLGAVFTRHREGLAFLATRGLRARAVSAARFQTDFRESLARQRAAFLRNPVRFVLITLWRTLTRTSPHLAPIAAQKAAEREIRRLITGRAS